MKTYSPAPPHGTFTIPDKKKHYLIRITGGFGLVFDTQYGDSRYKTLSLIKGYVWMSYEANTLEKLFEIAIGYRATVLEFDTMKELLEYVVKN